MWKVSVSKLGKAWYVSWSHACTQALGTIHSNHMSSILDQILGIRNTLWTSNNKEQNSTFLPPSHPINASFWKAQVESHFYICPLLWDVAGRISEQSPDDLRCPLKLSWLWFLPRRTVTSFPQSCSGDKEGRSEQTSASLSCFCPNVISSKI